MIRKLNNIKLSLAILTLFFGIYNNSKMALFFLTLLIFMNLIIHNFKELENAAPAPSQGNQESEGVPHAW